MNKYARAVIAAAIVALSLAAGYLWGNRSHPGANGTTAPAATQADAKPARKLLYYRNPMGLPDTSPVPKKDPMGMEYVAVYEGEEPEPEGGGVRIGVEKVQKLGVRTEAAASRVLERVVSAAGRVEVDERRVFAITPKFEGWVERLHVNATGQPVARGQALFEAYSPELVSAQREYAIALDAAKALEGAGGDSSASMGRLADSSLARLRNWDVPPEEVKVLARSGQTRRTLTFVSPVSGVVMEKKALQGMRFMPGENLFQVADLSTVWVLADVYEQDIGSVRTGAMAKVRISAYPAETFDGRITYVYPTLKPETRTVPVRIEVPNPRGMLKPGMFAQVDLAIGGRDKVLTVPVSAIIDSGARRIVLLQQAEGRFQPREVKTGNRTDTHVQVLEGVREGEQVVVAANFLIDAESNLKAAIGGFGHAAHGASAPPPAAASSAAAGGAGHRAEGKVESVDPKAGTVSIEHGPVATLKWPAMSMEFKAANSALLAALKPGSNVAFEFVERSPGDWVITAVRPQSASGAHQGH
jgi:Cu(I)/Ag(I) efflux system membrane fusion protein